MNNVLHDFYNCPISRLPIRYPIMASDGRIYELKMLLVHVKTSGAISPVIRIPLTSVIYSAPLQDFIDAVVEANDSSNRYEDYDRNAALSELMTFFNQPASFNPFLMFGRPTVRATMSDLPTTLVCTLSAGLALFVLFYLVTEILADTSESFKEKVPGQYLPVFVLDLVLAWIASYFWNQQIPEPLLSDSMLLR